MNEAPKRIQLRRTKGWRKPAGVVVVSRPSKWGNPWKVYRRAGSWGVLGRGDWTSSEEWTKADAASYAVELFRSLHPGTTYADHDIRNALAGRDLACWCPLNQPCHADVLLEVANS
jgi:hypothetical protein